MSKSYGPNERALRAFVSKFKEESYPELNLDESFERFVAFEILKGVETDPEAVSLGIVDGKKDGGIDGFYVSVNGALVNADDLDETVESLRKGRMTKPRVDVYVFQAKLESNYKPDYWEKMGTSLQVLLEDARDDVAIQEIYNAAVVRQTGIYLQVVDALITAFPVVSFHIYSVVSGEKNAEDDALYVDARRIAADRIKSRLTHSSSVTVSDLNSIQLLEMHQKESIAPAVLNFTNLMRAENDQANSYLGLVSLSDYLAFIRAESGGIRAEIFDDNVRDFEGSTEVNGAIVETLSDSGPAEFWWMNNGVTIIGDKVEGQASRLTVSSPMVVNGLQSSHILHQVEDNGVLHDSRKSNNILVRIIETEDPEIKDRVIAGTNRQNPVPPNSLRATEDVHKKIETHFRAFGWGYERRKNYYKNLGFAHSRRVTLVYLSQVMMSILLGDPDQARARPGSYLRRVDVYREIFQSGLGNDVFLRAAILFKEIEGLLRKDQNEEISGDYANLRFYVPVVYALLQTRVKKFEDLHFAQRSGDFSSIDEAVLEQAIWMVIKSANKFEAKNQIKNRDTVFKNSDFKDSIFGEVFALSNADQNTAIPNFSDTTADN